MDVVKLIRVQVEKKGTNFNMNTDKFSDKGLLRNQKIQKFPNLTPALKTLINQTPREANIRKFIWKSLTIPYIRLYIGYLKRRREE